MSMIQLVRGANATNIIFDYDDWNVDGKRIRIGSENHPPEASFLGRICVFIE
jgi:hypothetical protein